MGFVHSEPPTVKRAGKAEVVARDSIMARSARPAARKQHLMLTCEDDLDTGKNKLIPRWRYKLIGCETVDSVQRLVKW